MKPAARREAVGYIMQRHAYRQRRAYRLVGLRVQWHSIARDEALRARLRELAAHYRRYGYLRLHALMTSGSLVVNAKRTYQVCREEGQ